MMNTKVTRFFFLPHPNRSQHLPADSDLRRVMSERAKNYLPLLCNIYVSRPGGSEESNQRGSVLATLKEYAAVTPAANLEKMFSAALGNYSGPGAEDSFVRDATLDILKAYLPYQGEANLEKIYQLAVKEVGCSSHTSQSIRSCLKVSW